MIHFGATATLDVAKHRRGIVTLWQVEDPEQCVPFDGRRNIGLHHLALKVVDRSALEALHARVAAWPGIVIEFVPERSGKGPKVHLWRENLVASGSSSSAFLMSLANGGLFFRRAAR